MAELAFPRVRVSGSAAARGLQYGEQAADRIRHNVDIYQEVFLHYTGWDWRTVTEHAESYEPAIQAYRPHFIDEMKGIAQGAGLPYQDILALNVRTEIMFAAVARAAAQECTAVVVLPAASRDGNTLIAQNWDWKLKAADTVVILEAEPDTGPRFVTTVEAGLLAKTGMNSCGIGLVTNALVTNKDKGKPGVPYHAILRAILESETMTDAVLAVTHHRRASSANYLVAHRDGVAINLEAAPGDYSRVYWEIPRDALFCHTNHFFCTGFDLKDVELWNGPGSLFRQHRALEILAGWGGTCDISGVQAALTDHFNFPYSVCAHRDPRLPEVEDYASILSIIMDLTDATIWLADGNPCEKTYAKLDTPLLQREVARIM
jgi:isopenicillin-N N-acyltransferase-like protein